MFNMFFQNLEKKDHFFYPDFVRFNANRCNVCAILHKVHKSVIQKNPSKSCGGCKLISYCGTEHQKLDWPMHKDFCKSVQTFLTDSKLEHPLNDHNDIIHTKSDLKNRAKELSILLKLLLGRSLKKYELDLLYFPRICSNCFSLKISNQWNFCSMISDNNNNGSSTSSSSSSSGSLSSNFIDNNGCKLVSYCSKQCKKSDEFEHSKNCKNLQIATNFYEKDIIPNIKLILKKMIKLNMRNENNIIDILEKFTNIKIPKLPKNLDEYHKFYTASRYNYIMTIAYIIDYCNILNKLQVNNILTIYIVGGNENIINFQNEFILFLISQIPSIKKIILIFVSELLNDVNNILSEINYKGKKYESELHFVPVNINDFLASVMMKELMFGHISKYVTVDKPDLILSFDCEFSKSSNTIIDCFNKISSILRLSNIPIAFTSRTQTESIKDWNTVKEIAIDMDITFEILMKIKQNPFKDCRPKRNLYPNDEDISFVNNYLSIIKTEK